MTGPGFGVSGNRIAIRLKVRIPLVPASPVTVGAAVAEGAVIQEEGAA